MIIYVLASLFIGENLFTHKETWLKTQEEILVLQKTINSKDIELKTAREKPNNQLNYKKINYISCDRVVGNCIIPRSTGVPVNSVCIWNYVAGNGPVSYQETTKEIHSLLDVPDTMNDLRVFCIDDIGQIYFSRENIK